MPVIDPFGIGKKNESSSMINSFESLAPKNWYYTIARYINTKQHFMIDSESEFGCFELSHLSLYVLSTQICDQLIQKNYLLSPQPN